MSDEDKKLLEILRLGYLDHGQQLLNQHDQLMAQEKRLLKALSGWSLADARGSDCKSIFE